MTIKTPGASRRVASLVSHPAGTWLLGAALLQVWFPRVMAVATSLPSPASELFYGARGAAGIAIALVVTLMGWQRSHTHFAATWSASAAMTVSTLLLAAGACGTNMTAFLAVIAVCGAGLTWCCLQYAHMFSRLDSPMGFRCILLWFALAAVAGIPLAAVSASAGLYATAVFPLLSTACAARARHHLDNANHGAQTNGATSLVRLAASHRDLTVLAVELAVFGVVVGMLRAFSLDIKDSVTSSAASSALVLTQCATLLAIRGRTGRPIRITALYEAVFLVLMTTIVLVFLGQGSFSILGVVSSWVMRVGLIMLLWLVLVELAHQSKTHPFAVFGTGWGVYMLAITAGIALGRLFDVVNQDAPFFLTLAYLLAVSVVTIMGVLRRREERYFATDGAWAKVANEQNQASQLSTANNGVETTPVCAPPNIDEACGRVGRERGLSEREIEVMRLICKGRSKRYISEQLVLSENTVKFHARQVYQKLGVHSRQELMSLAGIE